MKKTILLLVALFPLLLTAQITSSSHQQQIWASFLNQSRWSDHWGSWLETQYKTQNDFVKDVDIIEKTAGVVYFINKNVKLTGAYTHINQFSNTSAHTQTIEHRPWQMIQVKTDIDKFKISHWFRLEERFKELTDHSFDLSYRYRYNIFTTYPLTKNASEKNGLSLALSNELFLQNGKNIVNNAFDQNRFFVGFWYYVNNHDQLQFGYTKSYQISGSGTKDKSLDVIKVAYFNNIDWRNKHNSKS
jgi:hypothetical protein